MRFHFNGYAVYDTHLTDPNPVSAPVLAFDLCDNTSLGIPVLMFPNKIHSTEP